MEWFSDRPISDSFKLKRKRKCSPSNSSMRCPDERHQKDDNVDMETPIWFPVDQKINVTSINDDESY